MTRLFLYIISLLVISSCVTIDKYTVERINELSQSQFEMGKQYVFDNAAFGYFPGTYELQILNNDKDNDWTIWSEVEPKYVDKDSLLYTYKTSIELVAENKIQFKLIDTLGNVKREMIKKYSKNNNYIKYYVSRNEFKFLINRLDGANIYLYLDNKNNLFLTRDGGTTVFFIIMPFGGTNGSITQKYKNIKNNP